MKRSDLTPSQIDQCLDVLNNRHTGSMVTGWIMVRGLSHPAIAFLKQNGFIEKGENGRYYPKCSRSSLYPIFSIQNADLWLPVDFLWRVVEPMLADGHAGYSITAHARWELLNLYSRGQRGYSDSNEEEIQRILLELSAYGYIYFQYGGSVWCIDRRTDVVAA